VANWSDVSEFYIKIANDESLGGDGMTNMRLQKLLYFAQGKHLAATGRPLFDETIKAWPYGPVVPPAYNKYKKYSNGTIETPVSIYTSDVFDNTEIKTILDVARWAEVYSTIALMNITHAVGSPWYDTFNTDRYGEISIESMRLYFLKNDIIATSINKSSIPSFTFEEELNAIGIPVVSRGDEDNGDWSEYNNYL